MSHSKVISRRTCFQWAGIAIAASFLITSASKQLPESEPETTSKFTASLLARLRPPSRTVYTVQLWLDDDVFTYEA